MTILQVKDLVKTYGKDNTTVMALNGVSFSVEKGEFVAVVGASGSGKSTLMHLIGGVDRPTSGSVVVDGVEIFKLNESELAIFRRRKIGIIYQFYNLIPTLTVQENIMLPCLLDNRKPDPDKLRTILETIGLTDRAKHLPNELSGGQQQRVAVGRALINNPALILADEPTGNLDSKSSREVIDLLKRSNQQYNQTLLVITHDEKIARQADRVITISDGQIVRDEVLRR
ncbi:putative ABC transport system ATP-binding protein [Planifilum fimeticola]|jgi:putative ABC transport system ATP-binding protein|uniref:Putative ABC transport system ATP-binding protein n=2 Tax=Planifilum TaxID=332100 RepID=A0A1I2K7S9_9BACL|nr:MULTISPECIES: ABC transporter ATP-binding protein [Planifilum]PRX39561.1 putative ABC transport system ATP-binding protein [Planifilum fimeticola]SFF62984.1 putative ABC transport system ATP-binding protein [Planifilum fulgidum]